MSLNELSVLPLVTIEGNNKALELIAKHKREILFAEAVVQCHNIVNQAHAGIITSAEMLDALATVTNVSRVLKIGDKDLITGLTVTIADLVTGSTVRP